MAHNLDLLRTTAMDRHQYGVHRTLPDDSNCIGNRIAVDHREAAAPRGVHPGPLDREQDGRDCGGTLIS